MAERSEDPRAWAQIVERIMFQVFYRQLGMVAIHCPIDVAAKAIDILSREKGYGQWKWLLEGRALVWFDVPIDGVMKIHAYVFGSKLRRQNTVLVRQGFWRMYFLEAGLRAFNETVVGRVLAVVGGGSREAR
jgi:hypothetical protein